MRNIKISKSYKKKKNEIAGPQKLKQYITEVYCIYTQRKSIKKGCYTLITSLLGFWLCWPEQTLAHLISYQIYPSIKTLAIVPIPCKTVGLLIPNNLDVT